MVWLHEGEKCLRTHLAVSSEYRRVTNEETDRHLATAQSALCTSSRGKNWELHTPFLIIRFNRKKINVGQRLFCCAMLCISAAYAVVRCLSVRLSVTFVYCTKYNTTFLFFVLLFYFSCNHISPLSKSLKQFYKLFFTYAKTFSF